jgi:hypothetical protein
MILTTSLYCYDMLDHCDNNTTGWCIEVEGVFHSDNNCHFYRLNFEIGANTHASRTFYTNTFFIGSFALFMASCPYSFIIVLYLDGYSIRLLFLFASFGQFT